MLRAENGLVTPDIGAFMSAALGRWSSVVTLPDSGHHMMLDRPLVLLAAMRVLIADWERVDADASLDS